MAMVGFLSVKSDGGTIKGSARQKHAAGKSNVFAVSHDVETPDGGGKPRHRAFVVTKEIDAASPGLHKAQAEGSTLSSVQVEFWRMPPAGGPEENYYSVTLANAKVVSFRTVMANSKSPDTAQLPDYEEVGFAYESIDWSFKPKNDAGGTSSEKEVQVNPAPDKLNDLAKTVVTGAGREIGGALEKAIKSAAADIAKGVTQGGTTTP